MEHLEFRLKSDRLVLSSECFSYIEDYQKCYTSTIAEFQFPEPFKNREEAERLLGHFCKEMDEGRMYELVILSKEEAFLGMIEVHGLHEKRPEIGIWIKESAWGKGYAYEALYTMISYLNTKEKYECYIYEVDKRNRASIQLMKKFRYLKVGEAEYVTRLGRRLYLVKCWINI